MDELLRPSPAERRQKQSRFMIIAATLFLTALIIAGAVAVHSLIQKHKQPAPPAAFLIALDGDTRLRINGRAVTLNNTLAVPAGSSIELPRQTRAAIVHPKNGQIETLTGPVTLRPETPPQPDPGSLDFLLSPVEVLSSAFFPIPLPDDKLVIVTSPAGVTRYTKPLITWKTHPGMHYDVAVVDPAAPDAPLRLMLNTLPPVPLEKLETTEDRVLATDRIYNVIVRAAGRETPAGGKNFLVSPDATDATLPDSPPALLIEAINALTERPARTGDGWLALSRLPADWAGTELVLRLRLRTAVELLLADEVGKIQQQLIAMRK